VLLTDLNGDGVAQVTKNLNAGDDAISMTMDVTQEQHWKDAVKLAVGKFGKVDILVNNGPSRLCSISIDRY
jgi:NADP-dependent 3-hydroxy acid dehydrogenase YdfG